MTERHLGNGVVQQYRDEERVCPWSRHGLAHEPHHYRYVHTRPDGEITTGSYERDGLTEAQAGRPFPLPPFDVAERAKAIDTLLGLHHSLPFEHPERPGVLRAIEVLRAEDPEDRT